MDAAGSEYASGHVAISGGRIISVGPGPAPGAAAGASRIDGGGCLATPGLVNCHHHLYQWLTRGLAQEAGLFGWLRALYPLWAHLDEGLESAAAGAGLAMLARSGCSTTTDHHYVWAHEGGDFLRVEIEAAQAAGLRFHPCRGSMDLGVSGGGLPPDEVVEERDTILIRTEEAIAKWHDPSPGSMLQIAIGPCSPFSVTRQLMTESADLGRAKGVRLHTHLAETTDEESYCLERFGVRPVQYLDELGWLGDDVWLAHCIHLSPDEVARFGATGTGVAHCPSSNARLGAGIAPVAGLLEAGAPVGLGVDGAASNEAGELEPEMKQSLLLARLRGGPGALTARRALSLATIGGARCLGRATDIGSLEAGKQGDVALWRMDDLGGAGIADPVAALALGPARRVDTLLVAGRRIVEDGRLVTLDEARVALELGRASRRLAGAGP
ncbi:MAG: 8-oxoguanine deaminase [Actinobacteria bacterium]|nr:8-oxoguanine deaminase [Actinomycetota bacterium]